MYLAIFTYLGKLHLIVYEENSIRPDASLEIHEGFASIYIEKYLEKWGLKKENICPTDIKIYKSCGKLEIAEQPVCEIDKLGFIPILNK